ncbi:MAG: hypothetical protein GXP25_22855 [Planctomycetes bacterium]|nr:hypothetical protein [Planctomycetota bacterium]
MTVRWPARIKPGSVCDVPVISTDFYPMFFQPAGAAPPEGQPLDGESLVPLLLGARAPQAMATSWSSTKTTAFSPS